MPCSLELRHPYSFIEMQYYFHFVQVQTCHDVYCVLSFQDLVDWHRPRMKALLDAGVDILALETIPAQVCVLIC